MPVRQQPLVAGLARLRDELLEERRRLVGPTDRHPRRAAGPQQQPARVRRQRSR